MQIEAIEIFHVAMPLKRRLPGVASRFDRLETVLVRLASGGVSGWAEVSPGNAPYASGEWAAGVFACLRDWMAPRLRGESLDNAQLAEKLGEFRGNRFAKAALDMAWWDLDCRQKGKSLPQALSARRESVEVGMTFDRVESTEEFLAGIAAAFEAGFARVKLKVRPGWDLRMLEAVNREFPGGSFIADVEGGLAMGQTDILYRLDDFGLLMVEQPLSAEEIVGHAMLHENLRTPICLDEGITSLVAADMALDLGSCQFINLKPGRVGGLTTALAIHDLAHENCAGCYVGAMPQTAIGARFGFALAAKDNCVAPADYFPAERYFEQDLAPPLLAVRDPADGKQRVTLWNEPGIGVEPDRELLERFSFDRLEI